MTHHAAEAGRGPLLAPDEKPPVFVHRSEGASPFLLSCDHAGRLLPRSLGRLGLPDHELDRHIAYDIGALEVSRRLADALDAVLIGQLYSRLVIDCNRPPGVDSSVPTISESTAIPGNAGLTEADRRARTDEIFRPYHDRLAAEIDQRLSEGRRTVLVAMHSFTPSYKGVARPWHIGTLYGRDGRLAAALRDALIRETDLVVGDNEPYSVSDDTDYAIPVHGERRGILHVGIEIRQDLITERAGQTKWGAILSRCLPDALARCHDEAG